MADSLRARLVLAGFGLAAAWSLAGCSQRSMQTESRGPALDWIAADSTPAFERADAPKLIRLPEDHGPHSGFQTEWWYYTGNLRSEAGSLFGYQLTFFRRSLTLQARDRSSSFAATEIYFAHLAVTDVAKGTHREFERFSRGAAGLAGASGDPFRVWVEDWSAESRDQEGRTIHLQASQEGLALDLRLHSQKDLVAHGQGGLSPKGERPGDASYYLSYTRMETTGLLQLDGDSYTVDGQSWFDHEWSTGALPPEAVGWDWFGLQLDDGRELMVFQIRQRDGSVASIGGVTVVEPDGSSIVLNVNEVDIEPQQFWTSPSSGAIYPSGWRIRVLRADLEIEVRPWVQDQEMNLSILYWEGAVKISGHSRGLPVGGVGYVELTGYAGGLGSLFQ